MGKGNLLRRAVGLGAPGGRGVGVGPMTGAPEGEAGTAGGRTAQGRGVRALGVDGGSRARTCARRAEAAHAQDGASPDRLQPHLAPRREDSERGLAREQDLEGAPLSGDGALEVDWPPVPAVDGAGWVVRHHRDCQNRRRLFCPSSQLCSPRLALQPPGADGPAPQATSAAARCRYADRRLCRQLGPCKAGRDASSAWMRFFWMIRTEQRVMCED